MFEKYLINWVSEEKNTFGQKDYTKNIKKQTHMQKKNSQKKHLVRSLLKCVLLQG